MNHEIGTRVSTWTGFWSVETARHGLRLMRVDEKATTRSPHDTRRTIGSENKNVSRALLRAFVKEVEIFPDDGLIKYAIPRGP